MPDHPPAASATAKTTVELLPVLKLGVVHCAQEAAAVQSFVASSVDHEGLKARKRIVPEPLIQMLAVYVVLVAAEAFWYMLFHELVKLPLAAHTPPCVFPPGAGVLVAVGLVGTVPKRVL